MTADFNRKIDDSYSKLYEHIIYLHGHFIKKHKANSLADPTQYDLDVKSYCVLSHAALEEFLEIVASTVMEYSITEFNMRKVVTLSLLTLLHFKSVLDLKLLFSKDENSQPLLSIYDYIRKNNESIKETFSAEIYNNHGVAIKYMKNLLLPVAINIPKEDNLLNSLNKIAGERGMYAHKFTDRGAVKRSLGPEQADDYVMDCLILFDIIADSAKKL
jgi:hypothetical protein